MGPSYSAGRLTLYRIGFLAHTPLTMMLQRSTAKPTDEDRAAASASALCDLCDVYTRSGLSGTWNDLARVYDHRRNDDNFREILDLGAPDARLKDLNGWHLERMAVGEYEAGPAAHAGDLAAIKREARHVKQALQRILDNGRAFKAKRDELTGAMIKQRDALTAELDAAKSFLGQVHLLGSASTAEVEISEPVPVEQRLRAAVKAPELSPTVDLSEAPAI